MLIVSICTLIWIIGYVILDNKVTYTTRTFRMATLLWPIYLVLFVVIFSISLFTKLVMFLIESVK
jgi:hypothetical protein